MYLRQQSKTSATNPAAVKTNFIHVLPGISWESFRDETKIKEYLKLACV